MPVTSTLNTWEMHIKNLLPKKRSAALVSTNFTAKCRCNAGSGAVHDTVCYLENKITGSQHSGIYILFLKKEGY